MAEEKDKITTLEDIPEEYQEFAKETKALMEDKIDST